MMMPLLSDNIVLQGGHRLPGRVLCDTWLYVKTDIRISRGMLFTAYGEGTEYQDYEIVDILMTSGTGYQKFRIAKLVPNL